MSPIPSRSRGPVGYRILPNFGRYFCLFLSKFCRFLIEIFRLFLVGPGPGPGYRAGPGHGLGPTPTPVRSCQTTLARSPSGHNRDVDNADDRSPRTYQGERTLLHTDPPRRSSHRHEDQSQKSGDYHLARKTVENEIGGQRQRRET